MPGRIQKTRLLMSESATAKSRTKGCNRHVLQSWQARRTETSEIPDENDCEHDSGD